MSASCWALRNLTSKSFVYAIPSFVVPFGAGMSRPSDLRAAAAVVPARLAGAAFFTGAAAFFAAAVFFAVAIGCVLLRRLDRGTLSAGDRDARDVGPRIVGDHLDGERLGAQQVLVGPGGVDPVGIRDDRQHDPVGDREVGVTPGLLHHPHE